MSNKNIVIFDDKDDKDEEYKKYKKKCLVEQIEGYVLFQNEIIKLYHEKNPKKKNECSDYYAVIVEPRSDHILLEAVCRNITYFLPDNWNLIVYSHNERMVNERLTFIDFEFYKTHKDSYSPEEYSKLLMSVDFWNSIPGENILIFQTDSFITKRFTYSYIESIKQYPFIGAVYRCVIGNSNEDLLCFDKNKNISMSGGFSFRKKSAMIDCIKRISIQDIINYIVNKKLRIIYPNVNYEDFYFQSALYMLNYNFPNYNQCTEFCLQEIYNLSDSHAIHGINRNYVYSKLIFHLKPPLSEIHDEIMEKCKLLNVINL